MITLKRIIIEYDIDYEKHLRNIYSESIDGEIVKEILNKTELKHIIYSQIGHEEEIYGKVHYIVDKTRIYDVDTKENIWFSDERLAFGLKRLMWICQDHYSDRNDKKLLEKGISWKIRTEEIVQ